MLGGADLCVGFKNCVTSLVNGTPGRIRTSGLLIRSQPLYPLSYRRTPILFPKSIDMSRVFTAGRLLLKIIIK
jgi:hypothetical protein